MKNDEFYVGYQDPAPPQTRRWLRRFVATAIVFSAFAGGLLVGAMRPFDPGRFELDAPRDYEGVIVALPYPSLIVARPGLSGGLPGYSRLLLVGAGKEGADALIAGFENQAVRLRGKAIYRDGQTLLKLQAGAVTRLPADGLDHARVPALAEPPRLIGAIELVGEIVDPQCFLGLMKPGDGVPHRACAIRCLAGGVPPVLYGRDARGQPRYHLLLGPQGERVNRELLPRIAETLRLRGTEVAYGELLAIHLDRASFDPPQNLVAHTDRDPAEPRP